MGLGIAYVAANVTQLPVVLMDISKDQTDRGLAFMSKSTFFFFLSLSDDSIVFFC
jgi:3-hydroxyacyl-CoA dehydrogenase